MEFDDPPIVPSPPLETFFCSDCERPMALKSDTLVLFSPGLREVVFACERCKARAIRTVRDPTPAA